MSAKSSSSGSPSSSARACRASQGGSPDQRDRVSSSPSRREHPGVADLRRPPPWPGGRRSRCCAPVRRARCRRRARGRTPAAPSGRRRRRCSWAGRTSRRPARARRSPGSRRAARGRALRGTPPGPAGSAARGRRTRSCRRRTGPAGCAATPARGSGSAPRQPGEALGSPTRRCVPCRRRGRRRRAWRRARDGSQPGERVGEVRLGGQQPDGQQDSPEADQCRRRASASCSPVVIASRPVGHSRKLGTAGGRWPSAASTPGWRRTPTAG